MLRRNRHACSFPLDVRLTGYQVVRYALLFCDQRARAKTLYVTPVGDNIHIHACLICTSWSISAYLPSSLCVHSAVESFDDG